MDSPRQSVGVITCPHRDGSAKDGVNKKCDTSEQLKHHLGLLDCLWQMNEKPAAVACRPNKVAKKMEASLMVQRRCHNKV